jgi:maltose alpha-D-glucosyltransferase/alpha-amylase
MVNGNLDMLKLFYSILLSLPGVPVIRYGDEIGMGDDLSLEGRNSVRTPMQWNSEQNAGFSKAPNSKNVIDDGMFDYRKINVLDAQSKRDSLLNWIERLISIRKQCPEIGTGKLHMIENPNESLFVHHFESEHGDLWFVHNFSGKTISFDYGQLTDNSKRWVHVFGSREIDNSEPSVQVAGYGFHWWRSINK